MTKLTKAQAVALRTVLAAGGEVIDTCGKMVERHGVTRRTNSHGALCINRRMHKRLHDAGLIEDIKMAGEGWNWRTVATAAGCAALDAYEADILAKEMSR